MASAQFHQQTEAAAAAQEQEETMQLQQRQKRVLDDEDCEPAVQIQQKCRCLPPPESAPGDESELQAAQEQRTGSKGGEDAASAPKSSGAAQLRGRQLAIEALEAQEAAQQAVRLAAEKQEEALAAAKEAVEELHAEQEAEQLVLAAKASALQQLEELPERACKQQKLSAETSHESQDTVQGAEPSQTTVEEPAHPDAEQKATAPDQLSQSPNDADVPHGDACKSATENTQQSIGTLEAKPAAEASSQEQQNGCRDAQQLGNSANHDEEEGFPEGEQPINRAKHEQVDSREVEEPRSSARDMEVAGAEKRTQAAPQISTQAPASMPTQAHGFSCGIQGHSLSSSAILSPNPVTQIPTLVGNAVLDHSQNSASKFLSKAPPEVDTYRTTPENQPTEQGPAPMQVG